MADTLKITLAQLNQSVGDLAGNAAAMLAARATGQSPAVGLLAGGSTAICGASAALALYGAIGRERIEQAQFTLTLVILAAASAIALVTYPPLARMLAFSDAQAGFLVGASVHDVAQAIGVVGDEAVHAPVDQALHVGLFVDGPGDHAQAFDAGAFQHGLVQVVEVGRPDLAAGGGHHGGAWKVAYADFVTAMMAFFLVMWLMGATTNKERAAISEYFRNPSPLSGKSFSPAPGPAGPGGASNSMIKLGGATDAVFGTLGWQGGDRRVLAQSLYEVMTVDLRRRLPDITAPVTVVYGWSADGTSPRSRTDSLFRGAYSRLRTPAAFVPIEGAEHMVMIDQPTRFMAAVERFLA